jgi:hypothetical protein
MALRAELFLKPVSHEHVDRIRGAVNNILSGLHRGEDVGERIKLLTDLTGREYIPSDFEEIEARMSEEDFVCEAALPAARIVPDITRDELIEIVRLAMTVDPQDARYYCDLFDKNVPMPGASSLIHWPEDMKDWYRRHPDGSMSDYNPTPEEIVDKATAPGRIIYL